MNLSFFLSVLISYIIALLAIAFYTLLERKALGYFQLRKGPNKVGIIGLPQPFADAIKLFAKEQNKPFLSNFLPFLIAPIFSLILALLLWALFPFSSPAYIVTLGTFAFLCISSLNVYTTLASGWTSNSKYALLGAIRSVAQTISYEVRIALILISTLCFLVSFNFSEILINQSIPVLLMVFPLAAIWFVSILAETNRTPFDLAEGESELVSGFNIEYSRGTFALIFIAEYASILIISLITSVVFISTPSPLILTDSLTIIKTFILAFAFVWIRATLPRIRYDQLINLTWKSFLPLVLAFLTFTPSLYFFTL